MSLRRIGRADDGGGFRRAALTALVIALLAGTTAAFALTEALKLDGPPVTAVRLTGVFSPTCNCPTSVARIAFTLGEADSVDTVVVDRDGRAVRVLAESAARPAGAVRLEWDGRDETGAVAPDGPYRLRIRLREEERTIELARTIRVDTFPPTVSVLSVRPRVLSLSGQGGGDSIRVTYRTSEASLPFLVVDGSAIVRGRFGPPETGSIEWGGEIRGRPLRPGRHSLVLRARDRAGNVASTRAFTVRIRR